MTETSETGVLIVGGGITGLSAAFFLARQGVRPMLVERHPSTAIMPQARAFNGRTMEIFRAFGLEEEIRERQSILAGMPEMMGAETLAGAERFRVDMLAQVRPGGISPADWALIDQDELERIVRAHAERSGADVRFGTELTGLDSGADGVTATVRGGGAAYRVRARYVIAADGHRAGVRERLGVGADGPGVLGYAAHFIVDADLSGVLRGRRFLLGYLDRPAPGTVLVPLRKQGRWMLGVPFRPDAGERIEDFTEERVPELVREAVGVPGLEVTPVPPVPGWSPRPVTVRLAAQVARRYRTGPVFFAGDAAHVFPPTGSYGASTGIADAHNLAWKLAAVLHGQAGPALLGTYEDERRPVARATMETSMRILTARHTGTGDAATSVDEVAMAFGYRYRSTAIHTEPGTPADAVADPRAPTGRPGLRAPHVPLADGSTLDLLTGTFTLLTGPGGTSWADASPKLSADLGIDLAVHAVDAPAFLTAYGITPTGATLIRPDGFVAWRSPTSPSNPEAMLRNALTSLLSQPHP